MNKAFCILLFSTLWLVGCASSSGQRQRENPRPAFVESVTALPDGSMEIVVSARVVLPTGTEVKSVNLRERLEQAAQVECHGAAEVTPSSSIGLVPLKQGGLKSTLKGLVRCSEASVPN